MPFLPRLTKLQSPPTARENDASRVQWGHRVRDAVNELQDEVERNDDIVIDTMVSDWLVIGATSSEVGVVMSSAVSRVIAHAPIPEGYTVIGVDIFGVNGSTDVRELLIRLKEQEGPHGNSDFNLLGSKHSSLKANEAWTSRISGIKEGLPRRIRRGFPLYLDVLSDGSVSTSTTVSTIRWTYRRYG